MLNAMMGSTMDSGTCTNPAAASASVSEWAKVKAVTCVITGRQERLSRKRPSTKST